MDDPWSSLLNKVQMSGIYTDSKTFVDKPMKVSRGKY